MQFNEAELEQMNESSFRALGFAESGIKAALRGRLTEPGSSLLRDPFAEMQQAPLTARETVTSPALREAGNIVAAKVSAAPLHQMTKDRLTRELVKNLPLKYGSLDESALTARIDEAVRQASAEFNEAIKVGAVRGSSAPSVGSVDLDKLTEASFRGLGLSESAAKLAVRGSWNVR